MALPTAQWRPLIDTAVGGTVLPANILEAMVLVESEGNPRAHSDSDARGLCQLIPRWHAGGVGKKVALLMGKELTGELWFDPEFSLRCGARHLTWCYTSDGSRSWERAVRKYFTGVADPPAGFKDGQGTSVEQHIAKFRDAIAKVDEDRRLELLDDKVRDDDEVRDLAQQPGAPTGSHVYIFSMGHRNKDAGGTTRERELTPLYVRAAAEEFRGRGATVIIVQEEDSSDPDRDDAKHATRLAVAKRAAELARQHDADAYLSFHYNNSTRNGVPGRMPGFHAVVPDGVGSPGGDIMKNNPKDVRLAKAIARHLRESNTVSIHGEGVFSEFDTGAVAREHGARLDEMRGTASVRDRTVRLVLEAADVSVLRERDFLWDENWIRNVYAVAIADGCEDVFGPFPERGRGPEGGFARPTPIEELTGFVANGKLVQDPPPVVTLPSGERMEFLNQTARAVNDTPRRQAGKLDAPSVGPDVAKGLTFNVAWRYQDGEGHTWYLTPFWTHLDADDVELLG